MLISENVDFPESKKYEKVNFGKLGDLEFETNKPQNDFDSFDLDPKPFGKPAPKPALKPVVSKDKNQDSEDRDSDSKEFSYSDFGNSKQENYAPFEDKLPSTPPKQKKPIQNANLDGFLDY